MIKTGSVPRARAVRRRIAVTVAALAAAAVVMTGCTAEPPKPDFTPPAQVEGQLPAETVAQLQSAVQTAMQATGSSGAIVGVWAPWSGSWVTAFGTQSPSDSTPVTTDMTFRIGDLTRPMACDVLYDLAADGKIDLADKVPSLVVGVADMGEITVKQLCDSTGGIGSAPASVQNLFINKPDRVWAPRELASFGLGQSRSTPGQFRDSDTSYLLLGLAVERASGLSASRLITDYVTEPLGLTDTALPGTAIAAPAPAPALTGLVSLPDETGALNCAAPTDITKLSSSTGFLDSGVTSTITELGRYVQSLAMTSSTGDEAATRWRDPIQVFPSGDSWFRYAGGSFLVGTLVGQHGAVPGYITGGYADPATGMTVVVVLNNSAGGGSFGSSLSWELAAIAAKAPAASGQTAPELALPFTAETFSTAIAQSAVCPMG